MEFELLLLRTLENPRVPQRILENSKETKKASKNPHRIGKWLDLEIFSDPKSQFLISLL